MTIVKNRLFAPADVVAALDDRILSMWAQKQFDTAHIARSVDKPESYVANRLAALRDAGR
ncbi:hypothetical protein HU230_0011640 [Bradyrhizobium quebecense]|uniref:Uncharacterized protein n=1 Tax=Bradyrhizobium quebecense TaxID=2748629 RepID=A0A973WPC5_9BRAD|nr:hypothetical protein [Bradyrhizobium quebecense]UGA46646.1 hypothetical protein HU230_0011640 [Bradyrhizobium quebecense]